MQNGISPEIISVHCVYLRNYFLRYKQVMGMHGLLPDVVKHLNTHKCLLCVLYYIHFAEHNAGCSLKHYIGNSEQEKNQIF